MFVSAGDRAGRKFPGLTYWIENYSVSASNATIPVVSFTVKSLLAGQVYPDVDAAIVPVARGGFATAISDGTTVGGNKRGLYSTDTQLRRSAANMVAGTDYGALIAGRNNILNNSTANAQLYAGIFVGFTNSILSTSGSASDGNVILGGSNNTINDAGGGSIGAGIVGGGTHIINISSGKGGQFAGGGTNNTIGGNFAFALGGRNQVSNTNYGGTMGAYSQTRGCESSIAHACNGNSGSLGATQGGLYVLGVSTGNATPTVITANGGAASTTNQVGQIPNGAVFGFRGQVVANRSGSAAGVWDISGGLARNSGGTITLVGAGPTITAGPIDAALVGCAVTIAADTPNLCIGITVTGIAATSIGWTAYIQTTERA